MSEQLEWTEDAPGEFVADSARQDCVLWSVAVDTDGLWCVASFSSDPAAVGSTQKFWGAYGTRAAAQAEAERADQAA